MNDLSKVSKIIMYVLLSFLSVIIILPYLWVISNSLTQSELIGKFGGFSLRTFIPENITLANYRSLFYRANILRIIFNTVFVATTVTALSLIINSMAAYSIARLNIKGKKIIFAIIISTMIIPFELMLIPMYQITQQLGIVNSYAGLIIPAMASAFGIFFFRQFFLDIPKSLEESAYIEGAGMFRTYWQVIVPLMKVPFITLGIMTFIQQWDNFLWAVTVINTEKLTMLQVALTFIASVNDYVTDWGVVFAGVVVAAVPMIIMYLFLQKYFIQSIATVGIKG